MPKRKRRPWLSEDAANAANANASSKASARRERERAFREAHPERFVDDETDDEKNAANANASSKASARRERERAFREAHPERFVDDETDDEKNALGPFLDAGAARERRRGGPGQRARDDAGSTDPTTFPKHAPCQTRDDIDAQEFERRRARVEAVTREIGTCARHKQLGRACEMFVNLVSRDGLVPSPYTYASLLNAYVNTGTMGGAEALMERMREVGCAPNVVAYTTMLKGYMLVANVEAAWRTLDGMTHNRMSPDSRAVNTYIRVCVRCGNLQMARRAFDRMRDWDVVPDATTHKLIGRLLAQGLKRDELKALIKRTVKGEHLRWTKDPSSGPCQFWRAGKCERGVNCRFYHDDSIAQSDARAREIESNDTLASMYVNHAHASAISGDVKQSKKSLRKAAEYLTEDVTAEASTRRRSEG